MKSTLIDLMGQRFGKLVVIARGENGSRKNVRWVCHCDCGIEAVVLSTRLRSGDTRSCGCLKKYHSSDVTLVSKRALFCIYRYSARSKGLSFLLSFEEFLYLSQQDCFYCGKPPHRKIKARNARECFLYNGLDRVDSDKGYEIANVVPCCKNCNFAKSDRSQSDFVKWLKKCYDHLNLKNE